MVTVCLFVYQARRAEAAEAASERAWAARMLLDVGERVGAQGDELAHHLEMDLSPADPRGAGCPGDSDDLGTVVVRTDMCM